MGRTGGGQRGEIVVSVQFSSVAQFSVATEALSKDS